MGGFSSKGKAAQAAAVTDVDRAILSLKTQRRKLGDYQKRTQAALEREREEVRRWVKEGRKDRALLALKKKRIQEEALQRADAWVLRVEQQLVEVETASKQAQVLACLKVGQEAMESLQKEFNLDDVEKLLADSEDSKAHLKEVQAMLDAQLSPEDEEEVLKELQELEEQLGLLDEGEEPSKAEAATVAEQFPAVPAHEPKIEKAEQKQAQEEEEEEEEEEREQEREAPIAA